MPQSNAQLIHYEKVLDALRAWSAGRAVAPLTGLALHEEARRALGEEADDLALNDYVLRRGLECLAATAPDAASLLRQRFQEKQSQQEIARARDCSVGHLGRLQRKAVEALVQALQRAEQEARAAPAREQSRRWASLHLRLDLTAGRDRLFGVEAQQEALRARLVEPGPPHILLIEGLGGIGKTALAAAVLRQILEESAFEDIAWVTAKQHRLLFGGGLRPIYDPATTAQDVITELAEQVLPPTEWPQPFLPETVLPALRRHLAARRGLLVVDNLETIEEVEALYPALEALADPAKILLTSRVHPHMNTPLHALVLTELQRADAHRLVRHLAAEADIPALAQADETLLDEIYGTVGGNPLALRLLVGQCHRYGPAEVLTALAQARGQAETQLYTYIYQHAWDALDGEERDLLLGLALLPPEGADLDFVAAISGAERQRVHNTLGRLVDLNLVEHRLNAAGQSRYAIHSLTRTFLRTRVLDTEHA